MRRTDWPGCWPNLQPGFVIMRMRRLIFALALAFSASAQAQTGPGVIHYTPNTSSLYRIAAAPGSFPVLVPNTPAGNVYQTTDLVYGEPGQERHRYFYDVDLG